MIFLKEEEFKNKKFIFSAIGLIIFGLVCVSLYIFKEDDKNFYKKGGIKIKDITSSFDDDKSIRVAFEDKIRSLEEQIKLQNSEELKKPEDSDIQIQLDQINQKINSLTAKNDKPAELKSGNSNDVNYQYNQIADPNQSFNSSQDFLGNNQPVQNQSHEIDSQVFAAPEGPIKNEFSTAEYLPAGSFASAKLLSSVDAGVGITSQSEPRPVLIRVESVAWSSAEKEDLNNKEKTDIRGCLITGEASGDLSSERGYIRLLDMTCTSEEGKVTETKVYGFVSSFGKAGVRGNVIEREGDKTIKAFFAGIFSSIGKGVEQRYSPAATISGGIATVRRDGDDIARSGLGAGFGTALDRLSQYYIDRMEQIQPVISLPQGLAIEIIFTKGSYLDGRSTSIMQKPVSTQTQSQPNNNAL